MFHDLKSDDRGGRVVGNGKGPGEISKGINVRVVIGPFGPVDTSVAVSILQDVLSIWRSAAAEVNDVADEVVRVRADEPVVDVVDKPVWLGGMVGPHSMTRKWRDGHSPSEEVWRRELGWIDGRAILRNEVVAREV